MITSIKKGMLGVIVAMSAAMMSCQTDDVTLSQDVNDQIGQFEKEVFEDLTIEQVQALETPYDSEMNASIPSGGRVLTSGSGLAITALVEILQGATLEGIEEDTERGLNVYQIIFQLEDGSIMEVSVLTDIFEIIGLTGYEGDFDIELDPGMNFISLSDALDIAKMKIEGEVVYWELELEEENKWEYEVHILSDTGRYEIEIDATTGDVLEINEVGVEDESEFEKPDDEEEESDEGDEKDGDDDEKDDLPANIAAALADVIDAKLLFAEKEDLDERDIWAIYVETAAGAIVYLEVTDDTEDVIYAAGEEGPFDYDVFIALDFLSLKEALLMVNNELQSETYYWYYEQIETDNGERWAFVIKVKNTEGIYHKVAVDAINGEWLFHEIFD